MRRALTQEALRQVVMEQQKEIFSFQSSSYLERDLSKNFLEVLDRNWIKVIMGVRRSGKSIFAHQVLKGKEYGYINFDDERLVGLSALDLNDILQFLMEVNPKIKFLLFDEIQNIEGWELFANRLQRQGYNLIITGSNAKLLSKELATHLTGRYYAVELFPFSFSEYLLAKGFSWSATSLYVTQERALLFSFLQQYLSQGGFPEMVIGGYYPFYLQELYDKIVARDITYRYRIKYSSTLKELAVYSHAHLGNRCTFHKVKNIFSIPSLHTVKNYF